MSDPSDITELDATTVERIAAGEVVERPASVVKELVENAIDADAGRVAVAVDAGGVEHVRVTDDGVGMTEDAVTTAVEKHTTSKISDIADLEGGVGTLGFRGEALHAIGAVSRLTVRTRPRSDRDDAADVGTELVVEGGDVTGVSPTGCPEGTTVEVADLFFNVPARRKYLKTESTEFAHVNRIVSSYALANPDVAISLTHDGRETFATAGQGDLREAVMAVYGREVARSMIPVEPNELPEGPLDGVSGLVSHPETNRASRDYLSTFVNGRYVTASQVREAVVEAYDTQLASDRYPFAVLDLAVDPATVDVNVHPRKLEVRFADEAAIREQVEAAVNAALMREGLVRTRAPRGASAAPETEVAPDTGVVDGARGTAPATDSDEAGPSHGRDGESAPGADDGEQSAPPERPSSSVTATTPTDLDGTGSSDPTDGRASDSHGDRKFSPAHDQTRLGDGESATGERRSFDALPSMRLLGQLGETYLVGETDDGLVLVDQHAADERINYERLRRDFRDEITTQALANPVRIDLTAGEMAAFEANEAALARLGFQAAAVDDSAVEVRTVPDLVASAADPELLRDVLGEVVAGDAGGADTVDAAADDLLADLACYPSLTGNTSLSTGSAVDLLARLDGCENPWACPHGRPTVVSIDADEIEARFERDYPGHGG